MRLPQSGHSPTVQHLQQDNDRVEDEAPLRCNYAKFCLSDIMFEIGHLNFGINHWAKCLIPLHRPFGNRENKMRDHCV